MNMPSQQPGHPTPADPALEALLDDVLADPKAPEGLESRVLERTLPLVEAHRQPVVARIGFVGSVVFRAAAAVALAAGVIAVIWFNREPGAQPPDDNGVDVGIKQTHALGQLESLALAAAEAESRSDYETLDYRIEMLDLQIALVDESGTWSDNGQAQTLDNLMLESNLDFYLDDSRDLF